VATFVYFFWDKIFTVKKPKLLLHICCIGCGAYVSRELQQIYDVSLYFYNPNIYPQTEYDKRLEEIRKVAAMTDLKVLIESYDHAGWLAMVKGHEADPERGERCRMCYEYRLEKTAQKALSLGYPWFASTLTVSPHKNALWINEIGNNLSIKYGLNFLDRDFKKNDGFKKATQLSRELHLYRQDYCGCEFSLRK
jgi:predicted adenine nucleotide alpha hydrolase (AANH) superfamily ATPase